MAELTIKRGDVEAAVRYFRRAVELQPASAAAHADLGTALVVEGNDFAAVAELREALRLDGQLLAAANQLAWVLATSPDDRARNGADAVALAESFCRATESKQPRLLDTLAAAYAETGQYGKAVETAERAIALARERNQPAVAASIDSRVGLYRDGKPFRESSRQSARPQPSSDR